MEIEECCKLAKDLNLEIILTPFDEIALNEICDSKINLSAIKIASCDLTNASLIKAAANLEIPLIVSTGMSYEREILKTSIQLRNLFVDHAFLHCNSTYPSPIEDSNLKYISRLKDITKTIVGYSSHEGDMTIPLCSISHGAQIVEFHITRSRESKGTDHSFN